MDLVAPKTIMVKEPSNLTTNNLEDLLTDNYHLSPSKPLMLEQLVTKLKAE